MDIWSWVTDTRRELLKAGHRRLAQLLEELPALVVDDEHARVDAVVAEALPLARAANNPWLEVFVRHWELQSRVLNREEVTDSLPLAVELIELASRPETKDCPQSVCATQDLAACYSVLDGPGYVEQRIAVAQETLVRIDPSWPCFICISTELVDALIDADQPEAALAHVAAVRAALLEHGGAHKSPALVRCKADALIGLGRFAEALAELELWDEPGAGTSGEISVRLRRAETHARLGQLAAALELLPEAESISATPSHYSAWMRAAVALVTAGGMENDAALGSTLRAMRMRHEKNGARFLAVETAVVGAEHALARGATALARLELSQARRLLPVLRAPGKLAARVVALTAQLPEPSVVAQREVVRQALSLVEALQAEASDDPRSGVEAVWELLGNSLPPTDGSREAWLTAVITTLSRLGYLAEAKAACEQSLVSATGEAARLSATLRLADVLSQAGETAEALSTLERLGELSGEAFWQRARCEVDVLRRAADDDRLRVKLLQLTQLPTAPAGARVLLAELEQRAGNLEQAFDQVSRAALELQPGEADWRRVELATLLGRWSAVRESAARLGMPVEPGDEPIDEEWGLVQIAYPEEMDGERYYAIRTGPVTARVLELRGPGDHTEHGDDLVVFDPQPLDPPPDGGGCEHDHAAHEHSADCEHDHPAHEHGPDCEHDHDSAHGAEHWVPAFQVVKIVQPGQLVTFALDGLHPGDDVLREISQVLEAFGGRLEVRSPDDYQVSVPELLPELGWPRPPPGEAPGVYGFLAVAASADLACVQERLTALCQARRALLVWPLLSEAVGDESVLELQLELEDCLGL